MTRLHEARCEVAFDHLFEVHLKRELCMYTFVIVDTGDYWLLLIIRDIKKVYLQYCTLVLRVVIFTVGNECFVD